MDTLSGGIDLSFSFSHPFLMGFNSRMNVLSCPSFNSIALRKATIVYNFGFSEFNKVKYRIFSAELHH